MARIQLKQSDVVFNKEDHTYFLGDKELSGITGMLERQLFPDTYDGVDEAILKRAAFYGTKVHESIELFDSEWVNDGTDEVASYINLCKSHALQHEASEYLVSDNSAWASSIDKVYRVSDNSFTIADIKTYGAMTPDKLQKVRWQLSIYAYLFELQNPKAKVDKLVVLHIRDKEKKDGFDHIADYLEVQRIPSDICKDLLDTDLRGERFTDPYSIPESIRKQESLIRRLIQQKNEAEERLSAIKTYILNEMTEHDIRTWSTETMRLTRKLPTTRNSFNLAAFQTANPDLDLKPFMRTSNVSASLTITI